MLVRSTGANEIGMRHFEMKGFKGVIDNVSEKGFFKWGFMRPTENLNRYVSVLASRHDQAHLVKTIMHNKETSRS